MAGHDQTIQYAWLLHTGGYGRTIGCRGTGTGSYRGAGEDSKLYRDTMH